mgnify:CR=1 FL=1
MVKQNIPKKIKIDSWDKWIGEEFGVYNCLCCDRTKIKQTTFHGGHFKSEKNGGKISVNYNYRTDNTKGDKSKHWGTHSSSELLAFIDVFSPSFKMLSKEARKEALSLQGIEADQVAELGADQVANFKIEKKADRFDAMTYNELKKLIKKLNIEVPNKRKDTLINALRSN